MIKNDVFRKGLSLIEVLVVITIFAVLGILVTQSVVLTLMGTRKSESIVNVRENESYALSIIERQIRNASYVCGDSSCSSPCPNSDTSTIYYRDQNGNKSYFACITGSDSDSYIASGSASTRLTSNTVLITSCSFACTPGVNNPDLVEVNLSMRDASSTGAQGATVSTSTRIYLRNY